MKAIVNGVEMNEKEIDKTTVRFVMVFTEDSDSAAMEFELKNTSLKELREQFGFHKNDPYFFNVHDIEAKHAKWIENHSAQKLDFSKYQYQLCSYGRNT